MDRVNFDPVLYANVVESALRERDSWDAGTVIEARRIPHTIGGHPAEIIISVRKITDSDQA